jgi:lysozyme
MNLNRLCMQIKEDEGIIYQIYPDHLGYLTFGVGHLKTEEDEEHGLPIGTPVTHTRVDFCLQWDIDDACRNAKKLYGADFDYWPAAVQEVLVNMIFNLGYTGLSRFKNFKRALEMEDWGQAAIEGRDSLWYRQVTNRAERLMTRLEEV